MTQRPEYDRFEYERLDKESFLNWLDDLDMKVETFSRLTGAGMNQISKWTAKNPRDIPLWVGMVLTMFENVPGAIPEARKWANDVIVLDKRKPELGEYPFQQEDVTWK